MVEVLLRSEEQRLLHDMAMRVFAGSGHPAELAASGLLALPFESDVGGFRDAGQRDHGDLAVAFAAKGANFATGATLLQAVLGGGLIARSKAPEREAIITGIIAGREQVALAMLEPAGRADPCYCQTRAERAGNGWMLWGLKTLAIGSDAATRLLVVARTAGDQPDARAGLGLFLIDPASKGVSRRHYTLRDGEPAADVTLDSVAVGDATLIDPSVADALEAQLGVVRLCLAAEAAGLTQALLLATARYTDERRQFGQKIGAFQVVQHKLAEMALAADQTAALVADAVDRAGDLAGDPAAYGSALAAAAELGLAAAKTAIQLHGGAGMTEDLPLGRALRRMMTFALLYERPNY